MTHLFAQSHPKTTPRISRLILSVQEDISQTYELLTILYQFSDQTLINSGFADRLNNLHIFLKDFGKSCEQFHQAIEQEEILPLHDFSAQVLTDPAVNLDAHRKEAKRAKRLTNHLSASFCKLRLGINDFDGQGIQSG